jgi:hypothetical protein
MFVGLQPVVPTDGGKPPPGTGWGSIREMRWRRGLLRLWLAISAIWLAGVSGWAWWAWYFDPTRATAKSPEMSDWEVGLRWMLPEQFLLLAATPPIATLIIGVTLAWVAAGFRRAN